MNKPANVSAIRLSVTPEVARALAAAKKRYPALSDPEILKVGLSNIAVFGAPGVSGISGVADSRTEARLLSADAAGKDYLTDSKEDIYSL